MSNKGQSIIEVIVAMAIFIIIASSSVIAVLGSFSTTRLAEEETQAALFATEGLEAAQSIRNQDWDNLTTGDHGLVNASSIWAFSGTSDDPNGSDKFTRTIAVADVERDESGDVVESDGTVDEDTKKITATITWNFTPTRENTVEMVTYLTNWQKGKSTGGIGGGEITACDQYCQSIGYSSGTCRANQQQCENSGEDYKPQGNQYCLGGSSEDSCCCGN